MTTNPYIADHLAAEVDFQEGNRDVAERLVAFEYADAGGPVPCGCSDGALAYYKATIGVHKCTRCGDLYYEDGERL